MDYVKLSEQDGTVNRTEGEVVLCASCKGKYVPIQSRGYRYVHVCGSTDHPPKPEE